MLYCLKMKDTNYLYSILLLLLFHTSFVPCSSFLICSNNMRNHYHEAARLFESFKSGFILFFQLTLDPPLHVSDKSGRYLQAHVILIVFWGMKMVEWVRIKRYLYIKQMCWCLACYLYWNQSSQSITTYAKVFIICCFH